LAEGGGGGGGGMEKLRLFSSSTEHGKKKSLLCLHNGEYHFTLLLVFASATSGECSKGCLLKINSPFTCRKEVDEKYFF
jgi:hypothetical protein